MSSKDYSKIANEYIRQVLDEEIPACRWVKLACQRQRDDLARKPGPDWPYVFKKEAANLVCDFIECLPHVIGRWETATIRLEPWQCFIYTTLFGWVHSETGFRRYTRAYIEIPRKNSKTTMAAGAGLYLLCGDHEPGAQVFSAAVSREQAKVCWGTARDMTLTDSLMRDGLGIVTLTNVISRPTEGGVFRPLSRESRSLEGLNPHGAIIDELHAHKTRAVFDVINQATGSRRQPMIWVITTAGDDKTGVCYEQHLYVEGILVGNNKDESYFGIIYTIDAEDDWTTEYAQKKANPNYGISVNPNDIGAALKQAIASAQQQNTYLTKRLNVWVSVGTAYFNMLAWENRCLNPGLKIEDFYGKPCIIGLDLASKEDIAAKIYLFHDGHKIQLFGKYYLPEAKLEPGHVNSDAYRGWNKLGLITTTPGEVIDFEFIERDLVFDRDNFDVREVAYDPWQSTELSTRMIKEGLIMIEVRPSVQNFTEPMKQLAGLMINKAIDPDKEKPLSLIAKGVEHNGDPVLSWMLRNVYAQVDAKENVYPRKQVPESKIDGAVAALMCLNRHLVVPFNEDSGAIEVW